MRGKLSTISTARIDVEEGAVCFASHATSGACKRNTRTELAQSGGEMIDNLRKPFVQWKGTENLVASTLSPVLVFFLRQISGCDEHWEGVTGTSLQVM